MNNDFKNYIIDYNYDGDKWSVTLPAKSKEDALERLLAMSRTAVVFGYNKEPLQSSVEFPAFAT